MLEIKQLTENNIPDVMQLSDKIFSPILQGLDKDEDKNIWYENYQKNGLLFGAYMDGVLAGFIFFYEKEKGTQSIHCWMDGVDEKYRGKGILKSLMENSEKALKDKGYQSITVNTFPEKFPEMYAYLQRYHFIPYNEESKDWHGIQTKKVYFRKKI